MTCNPYNFVVRSRFYLLKFQSLHSDIEMGDDVEGKGVGGFKVVVVVV